ncbi:hypothetical protein, partial [Pseudomonas oryzihabitans]|uniref:hypothetical protein n=1 Tax=Pseudomonas oryzihabitans TaxID=47885 RepID=UPI001C92FC1E
FTVSFFPTCPLSTDFNPVMKDCYWPFAALAEGQLRVDYGHWLSPTLYFLNSQQFREPIATSLDTSPSTLQDA